MGIVLRGCIICLLAFWLPAIDVTATAPSGSFQVTTQIREAYNLVFALRLHEAAQVLAAIEQNDPGNLMAYYVADFIDFFNIFLDDNVALYQAAKSQRDLRLRLVTMGDASSPYFLFVQAEIYVHRALLRMKFQENFAAASDISQAFKLLKRNQRRFPGFAPNYKTLGVLKAAVGTIPEQYKWAVELLSSMEGTVSDGIKDLERALLDKDQLTYRETQYLYMLALLHFQNMPDQALAYGRTAGFKPDAHLLDCFVLSHIAIKGGRSEAALQWLGSKPTAGESRVVAFLDLLYGTAKLQRLDKDADLLLSKFLDEYPGNNYRKEALQKLAWHHLVHDNPAAYKSYMDLCRFAGSAEIESDKYALKEAQTGVMPHPELLKARLLFDGGYYFKALEILEAIPVDRLSTACKLEHRYRSGRIFKEIGREYDALFQFKMTISEGTSSTEYYACAAALQAGLLYEKNKDAANATHYYKTCLSLQPEDYRAGLHQKAKAGLSRLKQ